MFNHAHKKLLMRAVFIAAIAGAILGCGEVTAHAPDGGGGKTGELTVSTGGEGGQGSAAVTDGSTGGTPAATGGAPAATGGVPAATGGAGGAVATGGTAGASTGGTAGADAGATGGTVVTIDAGAGDASACPRTVKTTQLATSELTTLGGTSTGIQEISGTSTGGGPSGQDMLWTLHANLAGEPDPNNPPAGSSGSVVAGIVQDCNGTIQSDTDVILQGYTLSFWIYVQGAACGTGYLPFQWRVGVVSNTGTTFPWGTQMGSLGMNVCSGQGGTATWAAFPAGVRGHALVVQFVDTSQQAFSGLIDVSDIQLTFKP